MGLQALYGVYAKDVHVRMACLNAVKCIPAISSRSLPENVEVATSIWIALHDPEKVSVANCFSYNHKLNLKLTLSVRFI